jgi:hypothetical protein
VDAGPGVSGLKSVYDSLLIDVSGGGIAPAISIVQYTANGGLNQEWTLVP